MAIGGQTYGDVRQRMPFWVLGQMVESGGTVERRSALNRSPQAAKVVSFVVTDPGDSLDVTATIAGKAVTVNTATGLAAPAIAQLLVDAINAEPLVRGKVTPSINSATITLTGRWPGNDWGTVVDTTPASIGTITVVTAVASAEALPFARGVIRQGHQNTDEIVALAKSSLLTAQVITATVVNGVATTRAVRVWSVQDGVRSDLLLETVYAGSATEATEATNIAAAVELAAPAATVTAVVAASVTVVFTAEVAGLEFVVEIEQVNAGDITFAETTGPSMATSIHRALVGVAERDDAVPASTVGGSEQQYPGNSVISYVKKGRIAVESSQTIVSTSSVYIELGVTADNGKFFNTGSATRIKLSRLKAKWHLDGDTGTSTLAALRLDL